MFVKNKKTFVSTETKVILRGTTLLAEITSASSASTIMLHSLFRLSSRPNLSISVWLLRGEFICSRLMLPCTTRQLSKKLFGEITTPLPHIHIFYFLLSYPAN